MLSQRRYPADRGAYTRIEWWGICHGAWVQVVVRGVFEGAERVWAWSLYRSLGEGRRLFVGAGERSNEAAAIREAFDALRREVQS